MGKSLLPDEVRGAYPVEQWNFHSLAKTLVEVLEKFKLSKGNSKWKNEISDVESRPTATNYARMNYEQLRQIAGNDILAEKMSTEEYEALSIAMWRTFGIENGLK